MPRATSSGEMSRKTLRRGLAERDWREVEERGAFASCEGRRRELARGESTVKLDLSPRARMRASSEGETLREGPAC